MKRIIAFALSLVCILGLASCGSKEENDPVQLYAPSLLEDMGKAGAFSEELEGLDADTAFALYRLADAGLTPEDMTDCAVLRSSGATCEEAAVLVLADSEKAQLVKSALEGYIQQQIDSNKDYRPNEIPKLEEALVDSVENTVLLVVANDMDAAKSAL